MRGTVPIPLPFHLTPLSSLLFSLEYFFATTSVPTLSSHTSTTATMLSDPNTEEYSPEHLACLEEISMMLEDSTAATPSPNNPHTPPLSAVAFDDAFSNLDLEILAGFALNIDDTLDMSSSTAVALSDPASPGSSYLLTPTLAPVVPAPCATAPVHFGDDEPFPIPSYHLPQHHYATFNTGPVVRRVTSTPLLNNYRRHGALELDMDAYLNLEPPATVSEMDVEGNVFCSAVPSPAFTFPAKPRVNHNHNNYCSPPLFSTAIPSINPSLLVRGASSNGSSSSNTPTTPPSSTNNPVYTPAAAAPSSASSGGSLNSPTKNGYTSTAAPATPHRPTAPGSSNPTHPGAASTPRQAPYPPTTPKKAKAPRTQRECSAAPAATAGGNMFTFCNFTVADAARINAGVSPSGGRGKGHKRSVSESAVQHKRRGGSPA